MAYLEDGGSYRQAEEEVDIGARLTMRVEGHTDKRTIENKHSKQDQSTDYYEGECSY